MHYVNPYSGSVSVLLFRISACEEFVDPLPESVESFL